MGIQAVACQGMEQAQTQIDQSARRIVAAVQNSGDTANVGAEIVSLLSAKNAFETNLKLAKTGDELQRSAIDLLA